MLFASGGGGGGLFPTPLICYSQHDPAKFAAAGCEALPHVKQMADPAHGSVLEILSSRISATPFNLVASLIFLFAILHTFIAGKITAIAHHVHHEHEAKLRAEGKTEEQIKKNVSFKSEALHFLGEVEAIFGIWVLALAVATIVYYDWGTFSNYIADTVNYTEPLFIVVIMALASSRPVIKLAENTMSRIAGLGGGSPAAWWFTILTLAPLLGSFITEPAAMTIAALLLAKQFYRHTPSPRFAYATLGLLFVNVSVGGTLTHFAAPPVLMVATPWNWDTIFMVSNFGWKAALGIVIANSTYFAIFKGDFARFEKDSASDTEEDLPVPAWITVVHLLFMGWTVFNAHHPPLFIGGFLFFLGFTTTTATHQSKLDLKSPILVGFFLAGLVTHGGMQAWWIAPVMGSMGDLPLMAMATTLTAFNDNAAITYLSTLVPGFTITAKYAVVAGAVTGGGLTVIANAPNPAGQSILGKFFEGGVNPGKLMAGALVPTIIMGIAFMAIPTVSSDSEPQTPHAVEAAPASSH